MPRSRSVSARSSRASSGRTSRVPGGRGWITRATLVSADIFLGETFGEVRDAPTARRPDARAMSIRTYTIQIALSVDGDEISGVAAAGPGTETRFHGWLGLMSAVDALVGPETDPLTSPPDVGGERTRAKR